MKKNIKRSTAKKQNGVNAQASERKHDCKAQVQRLLLMLERKVNVEESGYYIGIDLGDKKSNYCFEEQRTPRREPRRRRRGGLPCCCTDFG